MSEIWSLRWQALHRDIEVQGVASSTNSWLSRARHREADSLRGLPQYCPLTVMLARQYRCMPPSERRNP